MKRWRVGTFSMGLSLVLVGVTLLISMWKGLSVFDVLMGLWPAVFVMLGLEILVMLAFSKKEQPVLHYDVFSIFFVGVLGCLCIAFSLVTSTGVMKEIRYSLGSVDKTVDLPDIQEAIPQGIERIVVQSSGEIPKVDKTTERELHLFGSYRARVHEEEAAASLRNEEVATIRTIGSTMYISIKELSRRNGINDMYSRATMTLALPSAIPYELRGQDNREIKAEQIEANNS
jgi:hypothetical protein